MWGVSAVVMHSKKAKAARTEDREPGGLPSIVLMSVGQAGEGPKETRSGHDLEQRPAGSQ